MGKNSNPKQLKALVYAYQDPYILVNFDYRICSWYQEGKIVYSDKEKVVAYKNGFKTQFKVAVYEFHNVPNHPEKWDQLITYCRIRPWKYKGWLHHVNLYRQSDNGKGHCFKQIKIQS